MRIYSQKSRTVQRIKKEPQLPQLLVVGNSCHQQEELQETNDLQDNSSFDDSTSCISDGSDLCQGVEELSHQLKILAEFSRKDTTGLEYDTINAFFRKAQDDHILPPLHIQQEIELKSRESPFSGFNRPKIDLSTLLQDGFDTLGLYPGIDIKKQLEILKIKERLIIIDRWEEIWNQVRPPKNAWYSLARRDFSAELSRNNAFLRNKSLQNLEYQTRESLIELYHNLSFYVTLKDQ